jgi:RNA polymerase sigma-70 factor, ECF subfamily
MNEPIDPQPAPAGEPGSDFVWLFAEHHARILAYIYSLIPNFHDAEDICQKTSLVLWRKFHQVRPDGDFLVWACRVAYLEVCNFRRTAARDRLQFSDELIALLAEERPAQLSQAGRRIKALQHCVQQLTRGQQELLHIAYGEQQSIQIVAQRLGRAVQTVYNRLFRLRRLLLVCVEKQLIAEEPSV